MPAEVRRLIFISRSPKLNRHGNCVNSGMYLKKTGPHVEGPVNYSRA